MWLFNFDGDRHLFILLRCNGAIPKAQIMPYQFLDYLPFSPHWRLIEPRQKRFIEPWFGRTEPYGTVNCFSASTRAI